MKKTQKQYCNKFNKDFENRPYQKKKKILKKTPLVLGESMTSPFEGNFFFKDQDSFLKKIFIYLFYF